MSEHPTWIAGNRNPSIFQIVTDDDDAVVDLTGATCRFKAREVGSATLLVDQAVSNTPGADGLLRYDWSAADGLTTAPIGALGEARDLIVSWDVTISSKTQSVGEAIIRVVARAPIDQAYVELEEAKSTLQLTGESFADLDLPRDLVTASRIVDDLTGRRFYLDLDANQVRYYTPDHEGWLDIDDVVDLTSLETDASGGTVFADAWVENTDFVLEPLNAVADGRPWERVRVHPSASLSLPCGYPRSVKVTAQFGWAAVPAGVKSATIIIATRVMKRAREAPFGVVAIGQEGAAIRIARTDPDVQAALSPLTKTRVLA